MTTRASTTGEGNVGARVDGKAVVLVLDVGTADVHTGGRSDIKGIGVVTKLTGVTGGVVHGHTNDLEVAGAVDAHELDWGVFDIEALDGGVGQAVGVKGLWLGLATVGALAIPPLGSVEVDDMASGTGDGDVRTRDRDQRSLPLLVAEAGGTLEDDLSGSVLEPG